MPVLLERRDYDAWLSLEGDPAAVTKLLRPYPPSEMEATPVSTVVNSPRNDSPECLVPAS